MTKKIGDKKVGVVQSTRQTTNVEGAGAVSNVGNVKATSAVGGIKRSSGITKERLTRSMSAAEREELFRMINEEADKMFGSEGVPEARRQVVETAVKMAIDAGIVVDEEEKK
jgi:hypothetical protein